MEKSFLSSIKSWWSHKTRNKKLFITCAAILLVNLLAFVIIIWLFPKPEYIKNSEGFWETTIGGDITLIFVPAGYFKRGSDERNRDVPEYEKPQKRVYLGDYWIGKTETSIEQYMRFIDESHSNRPDWHPKPKDGIYKEMGVSVEKKKYPIIGISWNDASAYCKWLSEGTGYEITLPTEAQWEKAACGPGDRIYPWGSNAATRDLANIDDSNGDNTYFFSPVEEIKEGASYYGALNMAGNVWEFCADWFDRTYYQRDTPDINPTGPEDEDREEKVIRGGSSFDDSDKCRCAYRGAVAPSSKGYHTGFRIASTKIPVPPEIKEKREGNK